MPKPRFFKFTGLDGIEYSLTLKEKLFCEYYLKFKGSGIDAIYEAGYHPKNSKVAASMAYNELIKVDISAYITLKLEEYGYNDDNATKQHLYLMNQFGDLNAKRAAIDMFYKLKGRYAAKKIKLVDEYEGFTPEEIEEELARRRQRREPRKKPANKRKAKSS